MFLTGTWSLLLASCVS